MQLQLNITNKIMTPSQINDLWDTLKNITYYKQLKLIH